jgi:hypothetical protein
MADTRFYASDVQMPIIDYGAIYENAKAKREESETRKLQYGTMIVSLKSTAQARRLTTCSITRLERTMLLCLVRT